jgi:two-component system chemotaxis sensor kinase CheA
VLEPGALVAAIRALPPASIAAAVRPLPILVVDDSLTTRMLEQSILESAGYEVELACSAEEGLVKVALRSYGLILVDVEMPGMDGFGFIAQLRSQPELAAIPALLVTSRNRPDDRQRGVAVGAQGYVVKGDFDQTVLLDMIRRLVRR